MLNIEQGQLKAEMQPLFSHNKCFRASFCNI